MRPLRLLRLLLVLAVFVACQTELQGQSSQARPSAELRKEYREQLRAARKSPDPETWLRMEKWIYAQEISARTQRDWLRYIRTQYGIAAGKKIGDHDVDGWITLANKMKRLLQSDSAARGYLKTALK